MPSDLAGIVPRLMLTSGQNPIRSADHGRTLDDAAGQGIDAVRPIRDDIRGCIEQLVSELI